MPRQVTRRLMAGNFRISKLGLMRSLNMTISTGVTTLVILFLLSLRKLCLCISCINLYYVYFNLFAILIFGLVTITGSSDDQTLNSWRVKHVPSVLCCYAGPGIWRFRIFRIGFAVDCKAWTIIGFFYWRHVGVYLIVEILYVLLKVHPPNSQHMGLWHFGMDDGKLN